MDCLQCDSKYVGNTKQKLKKRMSKHKSDVRLKKNKETTGLTKHSVTNNHSFDFENVTILDHFPNYFQRTIAEKMYIQKTVNNCNTKIDKEGLHKSYINLLKVNTMPRVAPQNNSRIQQQDIPRIQPPVT